jgi:hypothetical protein
MEQKAEIKRIVLDLGDKEVTLSVEQAKKLKNLLSEMFGKEVIEKHIHHDNWYWKPWYPQQPYYYGSSWGNATLKDNSVYCSLATGDAKGITNGDLGSNAVATLQG